MKKKNSKRENINLFFSAFLMLAYIVCGYFFSQFANSLGGEVLKSTISAVILVVFGLLVFYATRVGEGKAIKRFSAITLILLDLPALYIIVASIFAQVPLHDFFENAPLVTYMAAVALGYGIPYTFLSGFETVYEDDAEQEPEEVHSVLEGGVEADLETTDDEAEPEESAVDEVVVEVAGTQPDAADEAPVEDEAEQTEE